VEEHPAVQFIALKNGPALACAGVHLVHPFPGLLDGRLAIPPEVPRSRSSASGLFTVTSGSILILPSPVSVSHYHRVASPVNCLDVDYFEVEFTVP
jgi:hypothetical protein